MRVVVMKDVVVADLAGLLLIFRRGIREPPGQGAGPPAYLYFCRLLCTELDSELQLINTATQGPLRVPMCT